MAYFIIILLCLSTNVYRGSGGKVPRILSPSGQLHASPVSTAGNSSHMPVCSTGQPESRSDLDPGHSAPGQSLHRLSCTSILPDGLEEEGPVAGTRKTAVSHSTGTLRHVIYDKPRDKHFKICRRIHYTPILQQILMDTSTYITR